MAVLKNIINRESKGFLDLLRAKVGGQGPRTFSEDVQPTIDIERFLGSSLLSGTVSTTTGGAANYELTVPNDELWMLHNFSVWIYKTGVTTVFSIEGRLYLDLVGTKIPVKPFSERFEITPSASVSIGANATWEPAGGLLIPSGAKLGAGVVVITASSTVSVGATYTKLRP